jgi:hypothetical protein
MIRFPLERPLFTREYASGTYSLGAYFVSKIGLELPISCTQSFIATFVTFFMMELQGFVLSLAWAGLAWLGLGWLGLAWLGLAWLGSTLLRLAWLGLG